MNLIHAWQATKRLCERRPFDKLLLQGCDLVTQREIRDLKRDNLRLKFRIFLLQCNTTLLAVRVKILEWRVFHGAPNIR